MKEYYTRDEVKTLIKEIAKDNPWKFKETEKGKKERYGDQIAYHYKMSGLHSDYAKEHRRESKNPANPPELRTLHSILADESHEASMIHFHAWKKYMENHPDADVQGHEANKSTEHVAKMRKALGYS